jgi:hypothetical protein
MRALNTRVASLSLNSLATMLCATTEHLAREINQPSVNPPQWSDVEWGIAKAVLALQGMSVLLANTVVWQGPADWQAFLATQKEQSLLRYARMAQQLEQLDDEFRSRRIPLVALKGAALYRMGIYQPGERPMGDIDVLVTPDGVAAARTAIESTGYELTFENRRHATFEPVGESKTIGFGEHLDHPLKIELHTKIAEQLPITETNITNTVYPCNPVPGLNQYPSLAELMRHLLLHAAGNMRARALRQIQLHDLARLAARMQATDWDELLATADSRGVWWAFPPLILAKRYYPDDIPASSIEATLPGCPALLRRVARRHELTDVSWSKIRIQAFPGIEWSSSPREAFVFAKSRVLPTREELAPVKYTAATQSWARQIPWYGQSHLTRIVRWMFSRPPRVQTLYSVREAMREA